MINNKLTKKYYSAAEITKHLNIALHQLRYLETKIPDLSNYKINNRKYYTANDIEVLQKSLSISRGAERIEVREHTRTHKDIAANFEDSSSRIDILLTNFHNLSLQIKKILADSSMTCV
ncbi:MAG: hypothetical protein RLZZ81_693 [Pseudomonadota bacterium]|jgi:RPE5 domain-containing protein